MTTPDPFDTPKPSNFEDVKDFHEKMGLPISREPTLLDPNVMYGRVEMMLEEIGEMMKAFRTRGSCAKSHATAEVADAIIDLIYFALGTAVMMGIPWDVCWRYVQEANMSKEPVLDEADSKRHNVLDVKKPDGFIDPVRKISWLLLNLMPPEITDDD